MPGIRYQLESVLTELGGDFRAPGKPLAVAEMQIFLTERANPAFEPQIVFNCRKEVERAMRIELTALAWEARVLPLYDARSGQKAAF